MHKILQHESASSSVLFVAAMISMIWANSFLAPSHEWFTRESLFWINEGLMAIFFLTVGLELKIGYLKGEFSDFSSLVLPSVGALFGMICPALVYCAFNYHSASTLPGWATPVATDIAFALGALSLFGKRVPSSLKLFLITLAILDDIGAILIIAFFFSHSISWLSCVGALIAVSILYGLNRLSITDLRVYFLVGVGLWLCLLPSGIHPTLAGVILALFMPIKEAMKTKLEWWVAFLIMPLFALANAGFKLGDVTVDMFQDVVVLGILFGLFLGKQIGIFGSVWLLVKSNLAKLPKGTNWLQLYGVSLLCGIGFTMSLFLGTLAFQNDSRYLLEIRLGVLTGSVLSGLMGLLILWRALSKKKS